MKRVFFKMFGWLFNPGIASQCFSLCLTATLLPHINCSFVSPSALCITTALCRKLRHHEHSTCHSMYTHVCHILLPTDRFACNDSTPWKNISKVVRRCAKKKKRFHLSLFTRDMCERCLCRLVENSTDSFAHVDQNKAICLEWLMSPNLLGRATPTDECSEI